MNLKYKIILREIFSGFDYSLQFIFAVIIGVCSIVGINSYKDSLSKAIFKESKMIMGSDLLIESSSKIDFKTEKFILENLPESSRTAISVHFSSMVYTKDKETSLALVKALDKNFPIYGEVETSPKNCFKNLGKSDSILEETLAKNLKLKLGEKIFIGKNEFKLKCFLKKEPSLVGSFTSFAPTVIIPHESLGATGLEIRGSRIRYNYLVGLDSKIDSRKFKEDNFKKFISKDLTIYHNTEIGSGSQRFLNNSFDFMNLLGLSAFFLGAVSLIISTRARLNNRIKTISTFKCLGAKNGFIQSIFLVEILFLAILGSLLGIFIGYFFQFLIPDLTGSDFLANIKPSLNLKSILWGIFIGIILPCLISIESLFKIKNLSPLNSIREDFDNSVDSKFFSNHFKFIEILILFILFYFLAVFETKSFLKGLILSGVLFILPILLFFSYQILRLISKLVLNRINSLTELKFVFQRIFRSGASLLLPIIGIGSGLSILILSLMLRSSLIELSGGKTKDRKPNLFSLDIRKEQEAEFKKIQNKYNAEQVIISRMIGARLSSINEKPIDKETTESNAVKRDWRETAKTREYFLSFRDVLYNSEKIDKGKFWNKDAVNEISVESDFAKSLGVRIGDTLEFNVGGVEISGKITNTRSVNWADMKPNFVVIFSRGILEKAPATLISSFYISDAEKRYEFQKAVISKYPNITVIDAEKTIQNFSSIIDKVTGIISLMTYLILFSGILLLVSSLYSSKKSRLTESFLFRILGSNNLSIIKIYFFESVLLGIYSFFSAFVLAYVANYIFSSYFLELKITLPIMELIQVFGLVIVVIIILYFISLRKIFSATSKEFSKSI